MSPTVESNLVARDAVTKRLGYPDDTIVGFISGNFNIIHAGHLRLFKFAREVSDCVIIGLEQDDNEGVTVPQALRAEALGGLEMIDMVVDIGDDLEQFLRLLCPDIIIKGKEFENQFNLEGKVAEDTGARLMFASGEYVFSATDLINREFSADGPSLASEAHEYVQRHNLDPQALKEKLLRVADLKTLVIGDLIVDQYVFCDPVGMSQEDPTLVVTPNRQQKFVGGAGIVAAHAGGLGGKVTYSGLIGEDETGSYAKEQLAQFGVAAELTVDETRPTTMKTRYRASGKTLLRVNELRQHDVSGAALERLKSATLDRLADFELVIFSDFSYGCLPDDLVRDLICVGRDNNICMTADSQSSSQMGDILRFGNMDLLTPTEREARLAIRNFSDGIASLFGELRERSQSENLVITMGADGMLINGPREGTNFVDSLPAFNPNPVDVAGAGDSVLSTMSSALAVDCSIWEAAFLGALAASVQVSRTGNLPITRDDLFNALDGLRNR